MKRLTIFASALLLCLPCHAVAQTILSAFVSTTLSSPSAKGGHSKSGFGASLGRFGRVLGGESEIAYYPELLDESANKLAKNKVVTFSGSTLIGPRIGRIRVYGAFGFGKLYLNVTSSASALIPKPASLSTNYFTVNAGGGGMAFLASHLAVRADLRYYRALGFKIEDLQTVGLKLDPFDFWRASIGLVAKF